MQPIYSLTCYLGMLLKLLFVLILAEFSLGEYNYDEIYDPFRALLEKTYLRREPNVRGNLEDVGTPLILSPYIKKNKLNEARQAAFVNSSNFLPGIDSYSGYITVDQKYDSNIWFWYFPVMNMSVKNTPWIIWLQGGPGAPSTYGLLCEVGPFLVTSDYKIKEREYAWTKNYSMLFIDNPVGTGFSFTNDDAGYATNQTMVGESLYNMLQQFLTIFPELREAPLFIAGESYAGKHVPSLGIQIYWNKDKDSHINLQGLAMGNGFTDPATLMTFSEVALEIGLLDEETAKKMKEAEKTTTELIKKGKYLDAFFAYISARNILDSSATLPNSYNYIGEDVELFGSYVKFLEQPKIRRALHVGNTSFEIVSRVYAKLLPDMMCSAKSWLEELLDNYRVMVYNGHLDTVVAYSPTINTYNSLKFSDADKYKTAPRRVWRYNNSLAGYYKRAGNFLEVMVRGAGHMVPVDKPAEAFALMSAFIQDESLQPPSPDDPVNNF